MKVPQGLEGGDIVRHMRERYRTVIAGRAASEPDRQGHSHRHDGHDQRGRHRHRSASSRSHAEGSWRAGSGSARRRARGARPSASAPKLPTTRQATERQSACGVSAGLLQRRRSSPRWAGRAAPQAQQRIVIYSSNDATLNKLVATEFTKATGIEADVVSAGSGVVDQARRNREGPAAGRHRLGHQPLAAADQCAVFRFLRLAEQGRDTGRIPRPAGPLDRHQPAPARYSAEHEIRAGGGRPEELGGSDRREMEGQHRLHRSGQLRLGLFEHHDARRSRGAVATPAGTR